MDVGLFCADSLEHWREWLHNHHTSEAGVWLALYKKQSGKMTMTESDAVDEAICYGWIDVLVRRVDEERYAMKFVPRKNSAKWSKTNVERVKRLIAEGRMTPQGLSMVPSEVLCESCSQNK